MACGRSARPDATAGALGLSAGVPLGPDANALVLTPMPAGG
jgi:hypothetical protein